MGGVGVWGVVGVGGGGWGCGGGLVLYPNVVASVHTGVDCKNN